MTDYLNTHKIYPDNISRRIDIPPGFDSYRDTATDGKEHPDNGIVCKSRPGCWHCWNIEAHKIEYVTAVKDKDGRPMNTPADIPYRYCPSCGRKLEESK